jgi:hypothetical protein
MTTENFLKKKSGLIEVIFKNKIYKPLLLLDNILSVKKYICFYSSHNFYKKF